MKRHLLVRSVSASFCLCGALSCSDPVGPSNRFLDVCNGRQAENSLAMTVSGSGGLNASDIPPGLEFRGVLRLGPEEAFLVQCQEGTATLEVVWPGVTGGTTEIFEGDWILSLDTFWVSFQHENGERMLIRLFGEHTTGIWEITYSPTERVFGGTLSY